MKFQVIVVGLLICLVWISQAGAANERIALRQSARALLSQQRYEEAIALYVEAGEKTDDDALQAHCFVEASQIALIQVKDADRALKLAERIRDPQRAASRALIILAEAKRFEQVIQRFADAPIADWPVDCRLDSYNARAKAYMAADEHAKAVADLEQASQSFGDQGRLTWACYTLGQLYENKLNDEEKAFAAYSRGVEVSQSTYASRNYCFLRRGAMLLERREAKAALETFNDVDYAKLPSDYWRGAFYLLHADVHRQLGNQGQSATLLTKVLRLPEANKTHQSLAEARLAELTTQMQAAP